MAFNIKDNPKEEISLLLSKLWVFFCIVEIVSFGTFKYMEAISWDYFVFISITGLATVIVTSMDILHSLIIYFCEKR